MEIARPSLKTNTKDRRFLRCERSINHGVEIALSERRINMRSNELYRFAAVARPTFYAHCANSNDALHRYETALIDKFATQITGKGQNLEILFSILLNFVQKEKSYFSATIPNYNYWLLNQIIIELYTNLDPIDAELFDYRAHCIIAVIADWAKREKYSTEALPARVHELLTISCNKK